MLVLSESAKGGEDKRVTISSVDTTSSNDKGEYFEPMSKLKSEEGPMKRPKEKLEHGEKPKEESRCLKKQTEPGQPAPNQTMMFTPQWKSDTSSCFSCQMFLLKRLNHGFSVGFQSFCWDVVSSGCFTIH